MNVIAVAEQRRQVRVGCKLDDVGAIGVDKREPTA
jgi:hypothetical protein